MLMTRLRVACLPTMATRLLIPALPDLELEHPAISVELMDARPFEAFNPERCDVLITSQVAIAEKLWATKLLSGWCKPVASPRYLEKHPHITNSRLDDVTLLHDDSDTAWNDWFALAGYTPDNVRHGPLFADFNFLAVAMIADQGVGLCPVEVFREEIAAGVFVVLSDTASVPNGEYYLVSQRARTRQIAAFTKWFKKTCKQPLISTHVS